MRRNDVVLMTYSPFHGDDPMNGFNDGRASAPRGSLPGPSRRITVEPIRTPSEPKPVPAPSPAEQPEREPVPVR